MNLFIRLTGLVAMGSDVMYRDQLHLWDDVELHYRPLD